MSKTPTVDSEYLRTAPIPDLVALFEDALSRPGVIREQLRDAEADLLAIEGALRDRLRVDLPGKFAVVGDRGYRTNKDGRGIDRVDLVFPAGPAILPPAPHLEAERSEGQ